MHIEPIEEGGVRCALIHGDETLFQDAQSALDVLMRLNAGSACTYNLKGGLAGGPDQLEIDLVERLIQRLVVRSI